MYQTPLSQSAADRTRQRDESLDNRGECVFIRPQNQVIYLEHFMQEHRSQEGNLTEEQNKEETDFLCC